MSIAVNFFNTRSASVGSPPGGVSAAGTPVAWVILKNPQNAQVVLFLKSASQCDVVTSAVAKARALLTGAES